MLLYIKYSGILRLDLSKLVKICIISKKLYINITLNENSLKLYDHRFSIKMFLLFSKDVITLDVRK